MSLGFFVRLEIFFEKLTVKPLMGAHLRTPLKPLGSSQQYPIQGFKGGP